MTTTSEAQRPRVIVCGSRNFDDQKLLYERLDYFTANLTKPIVCTGAGVHYARARDKSEKRGRMIGADHFAEQWAYARYHTVKRFPPDWETYGNGPKALHVRNRELVDYAAEGKAFCVAFWDGKSPGTKSVIDLCRKYHIPVRIVRF